MDVVSRVESVMFLSYTVPMGMSFPDQPIESIIASLERQHLIRGPSRWYAWKTP